MDPDAIDRVVRKYAGALGLDRGYSAHSVRATFITTALENGAQLEDVQKAAGLRDPSHRTRCASIVASSTPAR
jgi:integrase/recombinase XerD